MPFYRQIKQLAHLGMGGVKEATVTGWFKRTVALQRPLYETLVGKILESDYCQADETTTDVINKATHQTDREYVWLLRSVTQRLAAFFYEDGSRAGHVIRDLTDRHHFMQALEENRDAASWFLQKIQELYRIEHECDAAGNMCVVTSLLATCRNHDVNPRAYLNDVIARMPYMEKAPEEELAELLPHRWILSHPEAVISNIRSQAK